MTKMMLYAAELYLSNGSGGPLRASAAGGGRGLGLRLRRGLLLPGLALLSSHLIGEAALR